MQETGLRSGPCALACRLPLPMSRHSGAPRGRCGQVDRTPCPRRHSLGGDREDGAQVSFRRPEGTGRAASEDGGEVGLVPSPPPGRWLQAFCSPGASAQLTHQLSQGLLQKRGGRTRTRGGLGSAGRCGGGMRCAPSPRGRTELPPGSLASGRPRAPVLRKPQTTLSSEMEV